MTHLRRRIAALAFIAVAMCMMVLQSEAAGASALRAQVADPYTGGVVGPATPCPPANVTTSPGGVLAFDAPFTITTTGQVPNTQVDFYVHGARLAPVTTDSSGTASAATRVPVGAPPKFDVCVAGACGTVCTLVDPAAASLVEKELGRGFARTGIRVGIWVLAGLALIMLGRFLIRQAQRGRFS